MTTKAERVRAANAQMQVILDRLESRAQFYEGRVLSANRLSIRSSDLGSVAADRLASEAKSQRRVSRRMMSQDRKAAIRQAKQILKDYDLKPADSAVYRKIETFKSKVLA